MWLGERLLKFCRDEMAGAQIDLKQYESGAWRQSELHGSGPEVDITPREIERLKKRIAACKAILSRAASEGVASAKKGLEARSAPPT
jgi:hypothetical protein